MIKLARQAARGRWLVAALLVAACGGDDGGGGGGTVDYPPADLADDMATGEKYASLSAPSMFLQGSIPVSAADATLQIDMETCPVKTVVGDVTTYEGGCTTADGDTWSGRATVTGDRASTLTIVYDGFGRVGTSTCNGAAYPTSFTYDGTFTMTTTGTTSTFRVAITAQSSGPDDDSACANKAFELGVAYEGTLREGTKDADMDGDPDDSYWSGRGQIGTDLEGTVEAVTTDEAIDDQVCTDEALAGTTTVSAGGHTLTYTYDGATDCDTTSTVRWAYDGADRGEISGVECSAGGSGRGGLLIVGAALLARRRRSRAGV